MIRSILKTVSGSATFRSGLVLLLSLLLRPNQASAVCTINANFTYKDSGGIVYFNNLSTGFNRSIWYFGDGQISYDNSSPSHAYGFMKDSTFVCVRLAVFDTLQPGCVDTLRLCFWVKGCGTNASFTYRDSSGTMVFTNTSSGGNKYIWNFGDGNFSSAKSPTHVYSIGSRGLCMSLTVIDTTNNCYDTMMRCFYTPGCSANATFTTYKQGRTVMFINTGNNALKYKWTFGDGNSSTQFNPTHTYLADGTYSVKFVVIDSVYNCSDSITMNVTVKKCGLKAGFTVLDSNGVHFFINTTSGGATRYDWNFGDGYTSTANNPTHSYSYTFNYYVTLRAYDTLGGCFDSFVKFVNVTVNRCNAHAIFYYKDSNALHYFYPYYIYSGSKHQWDFGDGASSQDAIPSHKYSGTSRSITVTHIVTDTVYNCSDTFIILVNYSKCKAFFTIQPDSTSSYSAIIVERSRVSDTSTTTYLWHFGDGDSSFSRTPTHIYSGSGRYGLCLTVYDSGCTSTYCEKLEFDSAGNMVSLGTPFSIKVITNDHSTSVNKVDYTNDIKVFPNPGSSILYIENETALIKRISMVDIQGRIIMSETTNDHNGSIDVSHLPQGLYILNIDYGDNKSTRVKFIKN